MCLAEERISHCESLARLRSSFCCTFVGELRVYSLLLGSFSGAVCDNTRITRFVTLTSCKLHDTRVYMQNSSFPWRQCGRHASRVTMEMSAVCDVTCWRICATETDQQIRSIQGHFVFSLFC